MKLKYKNQIGDLDFKFYHQNQLENGFWWNWIIRGEFTLPFSPRTQRSSSSSASLVWGLEEASTGEWSEGSKPRMKQSSVSSKRLMSSIFLRQAMALMGLSSVSSTAFDRAGGDLRQRDFLVVVVILLKPLKVWLMMIQCSWSVILNSPIQFKILQFFSMLQIRPFEAGLLFLFYFIFFNCNIYGSIIY